jgi:gluconate 2-dehydrogenase gamma chain
MSDGPEEMQPLERAATGVDHEASAVSRRDVMRTLALVPLAGILEWSGADVARAARFVGTLEEESGQQFTPKFFTPDEYRTVRVLVDYVIPRDARSGSATDAKVPEFMDFMYSDPQQNTSEQTKTAMKNGLAWLDAESTKRFSKGFVAASDAERRQILDDIAWPAKARPEMAAGVTFFNRFRDMTAGGFFSSAIGWKDLPYIGNVAVAEWKGCPEPALRKLGVSYDLMNTRIPVQNGAE